MSLIKSNLFIGLFIVCTMGFTSKQQKTRYKCMIQMTNYAGEGAYVVISLLNPDGTYNKTLYVQGDDKEWYHDITAWWDYYGKVRNDIDAITGETIAGGARSIHLFEIEDSKLNAGYKIRFETAVEDQKYYISDVEFELTTANVNSKKEGTGYIRYVRMIPN
ncbi:DUF2271 domain-containing protein [Flavobacteriaceae bacterium F08102]|nr:DUF2271 domain-containing protein [Flavobacteriaceae bacterium F08102]